MGLFLRDPLAVPWPVVVYLAEQLGIGDPPCVGRYTERESTAYEHDWEIQEAFGYHAYVDREWGREFRTFLNGRAWTHAEGSAALFNHAVAWLRWPRCARCRGCRGARAPRSRRRPRTSTPIWCRQADYGPLNAIARNKVNLDRVITHWPDMLRVAGSLITDRVRAYDLLRGFGREGRMTPLGQAFAEYGRIDKTMHLLAVCDPVDDTYRRRMNRQLTVQESRHRLEREICHGKRGQIMQAYREGQEDQLAALGLVLNAVVLWTTRYLDAAPAQLEAEGYEIDEAAKARLSPLKDKHVNVLGRYTITPSQPARGLRPLRDPATVEEGEADFWPRCRSRLGLLPVGGVIGGEGPEERPGTRVWREIRVTSEVLVDITRRPKPYPVPY